jgi:hypothetical protein
VRGHDVVDAHACRHERLSGSADRAGGCGANEAVTARSRGRCAPSDRAFLVESPCSSEIGGDGDRAPDPSPRAADISGGEPARGPTDTLEPRDWLVL